MLAAREQARVWEPCTIGQGMAWLKIPNSRCRWHACTCATSGLCCRLPGRRYVPTGRPRAQPASSAAPSVSCETDPSGPRRCGNQPVTRVHSATPNLTPARCVASVTGVTSGVRPVHGHRTRTALVGGSSPQVDRHTMVPRAPGSSLGDAERQAPARLRPPHRQHLTRRARSARPGCNAPETGTPPTSTRAGHRRRSSSQRLGNRELT